MKYCRLTCQKPLIHLIVLDNASITGYHSLQSSCHPEPSPGQVLLWEETQAQCQIKWRGLHLHIEMICEMPSRLAIDYFICHRCFNWSLITDKLDKLWTTSIHKLDNFHLQWGESNILVSSIPCQIRIAIPDEWERQLAEPIKENKLWYIFCASWMRPGLEPLLQCIGSTGICSKMSFSSLLLAHPCYKTKLLHVRL